MFSSPLKRYEREQRAEAGRRQAGENRQRVDVAFVEHAEDDVDHQDRDHEEQAQIADGILERGGVTREACGYVGGQVLLRDVEDLAGDVTERDAGLQVKGDGDSRQLSGVGDALRTHGFGDLGQGVQRHEQLHCWS